MQKSHIVLILSAVFNIQPIFAHGHMHSKACAAVAKACVNAGYMRAQTHHKRFWQNCMKPIVLGRSVSRVTINAHTVKICRADKIRELKKELREFRNAS